MIITTQLSIGSSRVRDTLTFYIEDPGSPRIIFSFEISPTDLFQASYQSVDIEIDVDEERLAKLVEEAP